MTTLRQLNYSKKDLEFNNYEDITFPGICIVCGKDTKSILKRAYFGKLYDPSDEKRNHFFTLPVCSKCKEAMVLDKDDERRLKNKVIGFSVLGAALAILNYFLTYSIVFSITIFALFFLIRYADFYSKYKSKHKIELENYIKIDITDYGRKIKILIKNQEYAKYIHYLNGDTDLPESNESDYGKEIKKVKSLTNILNQPKPKELEKEFPLDDFDWDSNDIFKDDRKRKKPQKPDLKEIHRDVYEENPLKPKSKNLCKVCGTSNDDDSAFCVKCGYKLN